MSLDAARVIWSEGLFLRPHHFQQQERFFEGLLEARLGPLHAAGFGFAKLVIDSSLLLQGKLHLTAGHGLFADGTPFELPSESCRIKPFDVPEGTRDATVFLSAGLRRAGGKTVSFESSDLSARRTRFNVVDAKAPDYVTGFDSEAELKVGALNLTLGLQDSLDGALTSMPVARITERRADAAVLLDAKFIPPMLDANAQPRLRGWLDELHGVVKQRGDALASRISAPGSKGVSDFVDFLLLLACNRYEPLLNHLRTVVPLHPLPLYGELLKLAGECATYAHDNRRPAAYPVYSHINPAECFEAVVEEIRRAMVAVLDQTAIQIPLRDLTKGLYGADIPDPRLVRGAVWVLAATANVPTEQLRNTLPTQVKVGPPERIRDLVMTQVPGVRIEALPVAPRQIPFHANFCYFQLDGQSEFWGGIETSRRLALYAAGELPGLELQLWAIRT